MKLTTVVRDLKDDKIFFLEYVKTPSDNGFINYDFTWTSPDGEFRDTNRMRADMIFTDKIKVIRTEDTSAFKNNYLLAFSQFYQWLIESVDTEFASVEAFIDRYLKSQDLEVTDRYYPIWFNEFVSILRFHLEIIDDTSFFGSLAEKCMLQLFENYKLVRTD